MWVSVLIITQLVIFIDAQISPDEPVFLVNTKKSINIVSPKFLSFSLDPAILLTGLNISDTSLNLARHYSPAFIRIAGPSTRFVKFSEESSNSLKNDGNLIVTPPLWYGINEWLSMANLTPVFGINDAWNPKSIMPLLQISDQLNISCYWQLGYDCTNKSQSSYREDLTIFRNILDAFPDKKTTWKIVASDPSKCGKIPNSRTTLGDDLQLWNTAEAVVIEPESNFSGFRHPLKPGLEFWKVLPKDPHAVSFGCALNWAVDVGEAARSGFSVVLRQPRLHEIFADTPVFYVSLMHKILMGRNVLDVKSPIFNPNNVFVYAHCTRHQNNFIKSGAMTVFAINNSTQPQTAQIRLGMGAKNVEIQSYILTSVNEASTEVFLNDEKISMANFSSNKVKTAPKLRRTTGTTHIPINLPPKSVGFFVFPSAQVPVCANSETEMNLLMEEIHEDQNIPFSQEVSVDLGARFGAKNHPPSLRELQTNMEKELQSDEDYYSRIRAKKTKPDLSHHDIHDTLKNHQPEHQDGLGDARNFFIERAKLAEKQRKFLDNEHRHLQSFRERHPAALAAEDTSKEVEWELELTSGEIRKILADRARVKAAKKNIVFSSRELEEIMNQATDKYLKNKNTSIKLRRKSKRDTLLRDKKDINMRLLNMKTLGERRHAILSQIHQLALQRNARNKEFLKRDKRDINFDLLRLQQELLGTSNEDLSGEIFMESGEKTQPKNVIPKTKPSRLKIKKPTVKFGINKPPKTETIFGELGDDFLNEFDDYPCFQDEEKKLKTAPFQRFPSFNPITKFKRSDLGTTRYKPLSASFHPWRPSDMTSLGVRNFKKSHGLNKKSRRQKRSLDESVNSVENEIDSFINEINKVARLDLDSGDYQLVFPNKDRIEVLEKQGDTELKLVLHGGGNNKQSSSSNPPPTNKTLGSNVTSEIDVVLQKPVNGSNIQKIPPQKFAPTVWDHVFRKIVHFFQGISEKVKCYVLNDLFKD